LLLHIVDLLTLIKHNKTENIEKILKVAKNHSFPMERMFPSLLELSAEICLKLMMDVNGKNMIRSKASAEREQRKN
jgi:hypothetical protein